MKIRFVSTPHHVHTTRSKNTLQRSTIPDELDGFVFGRSAMKDEPLRMKRFTLYPYTLFSLQTRFYFLIQRCCNATTTTTRTESASTSQRLIRHWDVLADSESITCSEPPKNQKNLPPFLQKLAWRF